MGEFCQCLTQLQQLYQAGVAGNQQEFTAYSILYYLFAKNDAKIIRIISELTADDQRDEGIKHAVQVREAMTIGNYHRFFTLYQSTPKMGQFMLDLMLPRERLDALKVICKAYVPRCFRMASPLPH